MADKRDEENIDSSKINQTDHARDKDIPANQQESIKINQETNNMEVHHHAHNPAEPHHKKTRKAYFWEFLMLFLAVFCGSIAEYQLEHKIERERGKQYVLSMIEDLVSDSVKINKSLEFCRKQQAGIDSLSFLLNNTTFSDTDIIKAYQLMFNNTVNISLVNFSKRTISQLKNSGGMRLIPNKKSADEITKYSEMVEEVEFQGNYFIDKALGEVVRLNKRIFFFKYLHEFRSNDLESLMKSSHIRLANDDRNLMIEYNNHLIMSSGVLKNYIHKLMVLKSEIPNTIENLKRENNF
jgi:hypothetical protein